LLRERLPRAEPGFSGAVVDLDFRQVLEYTSWLAACAELRRGTQSEVAPGDYYADRILATIGWEPRPAVAVLSLELGEATAEALQRRGQLSIVDSTLTAYAAGLANWAKEMTAMAFARIRNTDRTPQH
jgi:hypothetical protein